MVGPLAAWLPCRLVCCIASCRGCPHPAPLAPAPPLQAGFNAQFSWSFAQLVTLHYTWNFTSADPVFAVLGGGPPGGAAGVAATSDNVTIASTTPAFASVADALSSLLTAEGLKAAVTIPNMPPSLPPGYTPLTSAPAAAIAAVGPPNRWGMTRHCALAATTVLRGILMLLCWRQRLHTDTLAVKRGPSITVPIIVPRPPPPTAV